VRLFLIKTLAKVTQGLINLFSLGTGYTWPGHLVLKLFPNVLAVPSLLPAHGVVLVSGTNGKTTTSKLITHVLRKQGFTTISNESGSNLAAGIVSALCLNNKSDYGVFEVDEFVLPYVLKYVAPAYLVLLNLSRDQLDRYGETDTILDRWKDALARFFGSTTLVLDATQPKLSDLPQVFKGVSLFFNDDTTLLEHTLLKGDFNAKNLNAALLVLTGLGVPEEAAIKALSDFSAAWGRGETLEKNGTRFRILLTKNPTSFNNNLSVIAGDENLRGSSLLFILNDNIPDGRDVSWIYDIDTKLLAAPVEGRSVYVSGTRAFDMAVRLNYAGITVPRDNVIPNLNSILEKMYGQSISAKVSTSTAAAEVVVLPNYSAMLELREKLIGRKIL